MAAGSGASGQVRGLSSRCGSVVKAPSSAGTGNRVLTRQSCSPTCRIADVAIRIFMHLQAYSFVGSRPCLEPFRRSVMPSRREE